MRRAPDERGRRDRERRRVAADCLNAFRQGDLAELLRAVGPDARVTVDGGQSATGPAGWRLLSDILTVTDERPLNWELGSVNGAPGLVGRHDGEVVAVLVIDGAPGAVSDVWIVCDPAKLRHWNA